MPSSFEYEYRSAEYEYEKLAAATCPCVTCGGLCDGRCAFIAASGMPTPHGVQGLCQDLAEQERRKHPARDNLGKE